MIDSPAPRRGVPTWIQIIVWAFLVGLLAIVGVGLNRAQQGTVQPGHSIDEFTLPLFSGYELDGQTEVRITDLRGKVVVINFWASWCKPCEQEAAELEEAWQIYKDSGDVVFIGVDYVDTPAGANKPNHSLLSMLVKPSSRAVGTFGNSVECVGAVIASMRNLPVSTWGPAVVVVATTTGK